jgi:hypothetical protein
MDYWNWLAFKMTVGKMHSINTGIGKQLCLGKARIEQCALLIPISEWNYNL